MAANVEEDAPDRSEQPQQRRNMRGRGQEGHAPLPLAAFGVDGAVQRALNGGTDGFLGNQLAGLLIHRRPQSKFLIGGDEDARGTVAGDDAFPGEGEDIAAGFCKALPETAAETLLAAEIEDFLDDNRPGHDRENEQGGVDE